MQRAKPVTRATLAAVAGAILVLVTSGVWAVEGYEPSWRMGGGFSYPISPESLKNLHGTGLELQVGLGAHVPAGLSLMAVYGHTRVFVDEQGVTDYIRSLDSTYDPGDPVDSNPTTIHTLVAQAVVPLTASSVARPYLVGGVGWMWVHSGDITYSGGQLGGGKESAFAITLGLGVEFPVSFSLNAFVQAAWVVGFTNDENTQFVPVLIGISH
jgi:opacity protein-like surface antigen